mmetsp:Transcript_19324/g.42128  ORF Transcript_19324/g.42128 Transcript_19324/m.42128 type:complete len:229 (-) Transcript_19324:739-1425(-)
MYPWKETPYQHGGNNHCAKERHEPGRVTLRWSGEERERGLRWAPLLAEGMHQGGAYCPVQVAAIDFFCDPHIDAPVLPHSKGREKGDLVGEGEAEIRLHRIRGRFLRCMLAGLDRGLGHRVNATLQRQRQVMPRMDEVLCGHETSRKAGSRVIGPRRLLGLGEEALYQRLASLGVSGTLDQCGDASLVAKGVARILAALCRDPLLQRFLRVVLAIARITVGIQMVPLA